MGGRRSKRSRGDGIALRRSACRLKREAAAAATCYFTPAAWPAPDAMTGARGWYRLRRQVPLRQFDQHGLMIRRLSLLIDAHIAHPRTQIGRDEDEIAMQLG